jgi:hypothetical protein
MVRSILILFVVFFVSTNGWAQTLILAEDLEIEMPESAVIIHSGNSILFKYDDWVLNHQVLDPQYYYPNIDLTEWMESFIRYIFGDTDTELPEWIIVLARNQAEAFGIVSNSIEKFKSNEKLIYSTYSDKLEQGHVFLLNDGYINHFNILSEKQKYKDFIALLKE